MQVYAEASHDSVVAVPDRPVVLRRVGATVGLLFGFGLFALLMAGTANAEASPQGGDGAQPHAERSLLGGLSLGNVLSPVTDAVAPVVESVVRTATPVLESVVRTATPVVESVVRTTTPVLDVVTPVVAPVTESVVGTRPHKVATVTEPAPNAVVPFDVDGNEAVEGTEPVADGGQEVVASQETSPPLWVDNAGTTSVPHPLVRAVSAPVALVDPTAVDRSDQPGNAPSVPVGPMGIAPGGGGSVGGSGGSHSADVAVSPPSSFLPGDDSGGRGPPGTVTCHSWLGYARPDCPS